MVGFTPMVLTVQMGKYYLHFIPIATFYWALCYLESWIYRDAEYTQKKSTYGLPWLSFIYVMYESIPLNLLFWNNPIR